VLDRPPSALTSSVRFFGIDYKSVGNTLFRLVPGPGAGPAAESLGLLGELDPTSVKISVVQFVQCVLHVRPRIKNITVAGSVTDPKSLISDLDPQREC